MKPRVAIVGLGLVGGSLARALARKGYTVVGVERSAAVLLSAKRAGVISAGVRSLDAAIARADVVVLAAPPRANLVLLRRLARVVGGSRRGLVVTDVSSVKRPICSLAETLGVAGFVGGHPMAGRERSGFAAADAALFRGRAWVLTPGRSRRALRAVRALARDVGARPVVLGAAEHDRAVAFLSHLPQVVSWALLDAVRADPVARRHLALAGPALADMTRIARSPRRLWREILNQNWDQLRSALLAFAAPRARRAVRGAALEYTRHAQLLEYAVGMGLGPATQRRSRASLAASSGEHP